MTFRPVSDDQTLSMKIVEQIRQAIADGQYSPGQRLPAERELSQTFQVSRTVVRDALKVLAGIGIIGVRQGVGAFVTDQGPDEAARQIMQGIAGRKSNLRSLFQIRKVLEAEGAAWAAMRVEAAGLNELSAQLQRSLENVTSSHFDARLARAHNEEFHLLVARMSGNELLPAVLSNVRQMVQGKRPENLVERDWATHSVSEHARVVTAIKNRDPEAARWAMKQHLGEVEETHLARMDEQEQVIGDRSLDGRGLRDRQ